MTNEQDISPEIIVLKFADSAIPRFKEVRGKDYIQYGEDNAYPEYLTYLYNKSAKHNAIIGGKANYIFGKGYENGNIIVNRLGETLNDISRKCILDVEIYGGFRIEVIWDRIGRIGEMYHTDYNTIGLQKTAVSTLARSGRSTAAMRPNTFLHSIQRNQQARKFMRTTNTGRGCAFIRCRLI